MKKIFLIIFISSLFIQSCKIIQRKNGIKSYKVNEVFKVELENEGNGGYQWIYLKTPEVEQISTSKKLIKTEGKLLVGYNKIFSLKANKPGVYDLEFHFLRSFEKLDSIPEKLKKVIKIKIKK